MSKAKKESMRNIFGVCIDCGAKPSKDHNKECRKTIGDIPYYERVRRGDLNTLTLPEKNNERGV